ncbi:hypothetical protein BU25DRAFT_180545 [Macroventuria anomochaeta]|uniref:Uncharacterized protein n=1 Tax=Macroventuria anomochaeta TaxID=301207 RepID=A0ACB6RPC6_9PLEO|nr:uncharacterized protein BU25DRAFT_180545 [Macroventuria anomochaeta]KAF2623260.1 hypothetical protein BU25DRAFT_180545 [Macroventuria anomochaeta]
MSPEHNLPKLSHHTTIILLSILPAVGLFGLLMGIWHCVRKRNSAKRYEQERQDEASTLHQHAFLANDNYLPERSQSTGHQVRKMRVPNLPNLKIDTSMPAGAQVRSAPAVGRVENHRRQVDGVP